MRKNILFITLAAVVLSLTSCKKDGVYKPEYRISTIYEYSSVEYQRYVDTSHLWHTYRVDSVASHIVERWSWKDNNLDHIDYYANGRVDHTIAMVYDGKRLTRINSNQGGSYATLEYDGRRLDKIDFYNKNDVVYQTYTFHHDGHNFSSIDVEIVDTKSAVTECDAIETFLMHLFDEGQPLMRDTKSSKASNYTVTLKWKNDNVVSINYENIKKEFKYDNKKNPIKGLLLSLVMPTENGATTFCNANNVTTATSFRDGNEESKKRYSYTYSDDIPVSCTSVNIQSVSQGYRTVNTEMLNYYYEE